MKVSKQKIEELKKEVDNLSHEQMAKIYRFSPVGHDYFTNQEVASHFLTKFKNFGGMTSEMSKQIGFNQ